MDRSNVESMRRPEQSGICLDQVSRKASLLRFIVFVPQTDTGGRGENPKVNEVMFVKELGKTTAVPSV